LYRKAIERGWDIPEAQKQEALTLAGSAMRDPDCSMKERLEGAKLVMAANGQNIKVDDQLFRMMTALLKPTPGGLTINGPVQINQGTPLATLLESEHGRDLVAALTENATVAAVAGDAGRKTGPAALGLAESPPAGNGNGKH
jgi:hypothetical protein